MLTFQILDSENDRLVEETALLEQMVFTDSWSRKEIQSTAAQEGTFCGAVLEEGKICGYLLCYCVLDECEIARIAVHPDCRRRGAGQMLLEKLEEMCREKGIRRILLEVRESNAPAAAFYRKNGFLVEGRRKNYYAGNPPEDAVLMGKTLPEK